MKRLFVLFAMTGAVSLAFAEAGSTFAVGHEPVRIKDARPPVSVYTNAWASNVTSVVLFDRACSEYARRGDFHGLAAFVRCASAQVPAESVIRRNAEAARYAASVVTKDAAGLAALQQQLASRPFDDAVRSLLNRAADILGEMSRDRTVEQVEAVYAPVMDGRADGPFLRAAHERMFRRACLVRKLEGMDRHFEGARGPRGSESDRRCSKQYLERLIERLLFVRAAQLAEEGIGQWPADADFAQALALARLGLGKRHEAAAPIDQVLAVTNLPSERVFVLTAIACVAKAADPAAAKAALAGLRATCTDDRAYVTNMRAALQALLPALMTEGGTPYLRAGRAALETCLHEEERVVAKVRYLASAPRSAEGAALSGVFDLPWVEHRLGKYGVYANCRGNSDFTKLKDAPRPDLVAMKGEGRSGDLLAAYDETGVHFYFRFRHPEAAKFKFGESSGAYLEFSVMPGTETGYHQVFLQTGEPNELNQIEWEPVAFGRRRTRGMVQTDQAVRDDAFLFHVFVPWTGIYTRLPKDGDSWLTVLLADTPDGSFSLGGGIGHEFGRGGRFVFDLPDARALSIRRAVIRRAAVDYVAQRRKFESLAIWQDGDLGDPTFYEQRLRAWVGELDAAAAAVGGSDAMSDQAFVDRFGRHLRDWADFRLALNAKREEWIEDGLFGER